jgi:hypothetical protein
MYFTCPTSIKNLDASSDEEETSNFKYKQRSSTERTKKKCRESIPPSETNGK